MESIKIIVRDSVATVFNSVDLVSGTSGLMCEFTFNSPWKNLIKNVIFRAGNTTKTILDVKDGKVEVPKIVLEEVGALLEIGVEGISISGKIEISSIFAVAGRIRQGADSDDVPEGSETWQQIYLTALEAKDLAQQAIKNSPTRYELINAPSNTLFSIKEDELRIMCPRITDWSNLAPTQQTYYLKMKIYATDESVYGYRQELGQKITNSSMQYFTSNPSAGTDDYGRKFIIIELPIAQFDSYAEQWTYEGSKSFENNYIGWYNAVEWYDDNGKLQNAEVIRINLTNESCHTNVKPYYISKIDISQIVQSENDTLILNGGSATENIQLKEE